MRIFSAKLFTSIIAILILASCTDANLRPILNNQALQIQASGNFCSAPSGNNGNKIKMLFVIDMSGSNIVLGQNPGTDEVGKRFDVIDSFLNQSCANENPDNKFAVIGFSFSTYVATCSRLIYGNTTQAHNQLAGLRNLQTQAQQDPVNQQIMTETYYAEAFKCVQSIISDDVNNLPDTEKKNTAYMNFFLTDGVPTDRMTGDGYSDLPTVKAMLNPILDDINVNGNRAGGVRTSPILYGENLLRDQRNINDAKDILGYIGDKGDSPMTSVNNVADIKLCDILHSGSRTKYTVKKFGMANLTAVMKQGRLIADSDMDGIADEEEVVRGFDPTRARSHVANNELLDGLCPKGVSASQCRVFTSCGSPNALGLSSCDASANGLTDGFDSDKDSIPDLLEIAKGGQANFDDRWNNVDGDSMTLADELAVGRDPFFSDDDVTDKLLISYSQKISSVPLLGCSANQESWVFNIDNLPVVRTLATNVDDPISQKVDFLKHAADENVIFIYYIVGKANDSATNPTPAKLYGQFLKVRYGSKTVGIGPFKYMGDINGIFIPLQ